jgi:hypothetical protein
MEALTKPTRNSWNRFILTAAGQEVMLYLRERTPPVTGKDQATIVFEAGISEGHRRCLELINSIIAADATREADYENQ